MGEYANVTSRRMYQFLKWLGNHKDVHILVGGHHPAKVTCHKNQETYPLPISQAFVNKNIVKDFMEWLVKNGVCTRDEFDEKL